MKLFAHRGYSAKYPENTMLAFQKAWEAGAEAIELDVHFSRDREVVIIHDESLSRTVEAVGFVRHHVLRDLLNYEIKGEYEGEAQHIPTLNEYLDWAVDKDIVTNIEIKNDRFRYPGLEQAVVAAVDAHGMRDKIVLSSFRADSVALIKSTWPEIQCGWLISEIRDTTFDKAIEIRCDAIHPSKRLVTPEFAQQYHDADMEIRVYTVDDRERAEWYQELEVDAIFTNQIEAMLTIEKSDVKRVHVTEEERKAAEEKKENSKGRNKRNSKKRKSRGGGLVGIAMAMIVTIAGSVIITKLLTGLLSTLPMFQ